MSDTVIKLENISKQYRLGTVGTQTLRGDFQRWWYNVRGKEDPTLKIGASNQLDAVEGEYVWALRDINLEVKQGEVLGIIGKNGAGKSTLLKLLSRVTGPTTGQIKVKGRIASLLEVGTGFHPELTGRENIFLNGAILGMTKPEIRSKFDEIVDFAGVAKYIDTPVKRYSSGMYVRLAFAVAAHLEPDILVVDEVLAVGDAEFQKKAIGKMQDISTGAGRTVLFVSHNMGSIKQLCSNVAILKAGELNAIGKSDQIITKYLLDNSLKTGLYQDSVRLDLLDKCQIDGLKIINIGLSNIDSSKDFIASGDSIKIKLKYKRSKMFSSPSFVFLLKDSYGFEIARFSNMPISNFPLKMFKNGEVELVLYDLNLVKGEYFFDFGFVHESVEWFFKVENIIKLTLEGKDVYNSSIELDRSRGLIWLNHKWTENELN